MLQYLYLHSTTCEYTSKQLTAVTATAQKRGYFVVGVHQRQTS